MKKVLKSLLLVTSFTLLLSCSVNPSKVSDDYAISFADKITYVKDHRTNLCFAIVASRKTNTLNQNGLGMSLVPCESVEKYLVNP